jgi:predicted nucleotidyltransferase
LSTSRLDRISPSVETLAQLLELLGEVLVLGVEERESGIDLTLNLGNLELRPEHRVDRGLAFADLVRQNRNGGFDGLGRSLRLHPLFGALAHHGVDFVVIGSIAGLAYGSAYPTYDVDLAYAGRTDNLDRMAAALDQIGAAVDSHLLADRNVFSLDTEYGTIDILRQVAGVETYEQLRRDSTRQVLGGVPVQVASLNRLIAMKRATNRVKDRLMALEYVELADLLRRKANETVS